MNRYYAPCLAVAAFFFITSSSKGQKHTKKPEITFEEVQKRCTGIPVDKKTRVSVARFNVTTPRANGEFGENLSTMLSNSLQNVGCFSVLVRLKNINDAKDEINFGESGDAKQGTGPKKSQMLGAQAIITGEITEYNHGVNTIGVGPFKKEMYFARIGFIVQVLNPETREMLFSKSVNIESEMAKGSRVGIRTWPFGDINFGSHSQSNPAVADAVEKGIIQTVDFLATKKDEVSVRSSNAPANNENETVITVQNIGFSDLATLETLIKAYNGVKSVQKTFKANTGTFTVMHSGTTDALLENISSKATAFEVTGFETGKIGLKKK